MESLGKETKPPQIDYEKIKQLVNNLELKVLDDLLILVDQDQKLQELLKNLLDMVKDRENKLQKLLPMSNQSVLTKIYLNHIKHIQGELSSQAVVVIREGKLEESKVAARAVIEKLKYTFDTLQDLFESPQKVAKLAKLSQEKAKQTQREQLLQQQQNLLNQDPEVQPKFLKLLEAVAAYASKNWNRPNGCFISYAWNTDNRPEEAWIQKTFLTQFQEHLYQAGITTAKLDIISNPKANNIYDFMKAAETDDFVLLIGSESLLDKHKQGTAAVCNELILINRKRRADAQQGLYRVLPIMLSGSYTTSFPAYFELYTTVEDWRERPYLSNLRSLVRWLYGIGDKVEEYQKLWKDFLNSLTEQHRQLLEKSPSSIPVEIIQKGGEKQENTQTTTTQQKK